MNYFASYVLKADFTAQKAFDFLWMGRCSISSSIREGRLRRALNVNLTCLSTMHSKGAAEFRASYPVLIEPQTNLYSQALGTGTTNIQ